jgi:hypothetical protein
MIRDLPLPIFPGIDNGKTTTRPIKTTTDDISGINPTHPPSSATHNPNPTHLYPTRPSKISKTFRHYATLLCPINPTKTKHGVPTSLPIPIP